MSRIRTRSLMTLMLATMLLPAPAPAKTFKVLHRFLGPDGANPSAGLISANGLLYGTTAYGGPSGDGTVFSIDPASGAETVLYSFSLPDGAVPKGSLVYYRSLL